MEDTNDLDRMTDLRILRTICDEIEAGQGPAPLRNRKLIFGVCSTSVKRRSIRVNFGRILQSYLRVTRISSLPTARRITRMISDQIDNLELMKAERPLTDEEEHCLRDNLFSLLKRVDSLVCWAAGTQRKKTGEDENLEKKR